METWILALGIGIILTEIMSQQLNHGIPVGFPAGLVGGGGSIHAGLIYISLANIYTIVIGVVAVLVFYYFLFRSKEGRALRAIAQDNRIARLLGIPLNRAGLYSFAIAGLFAGIIAVLLIMTLGAASSSIGDLLAMKAFIIVMFAGTGNLKGGIICALAVGVVQALCLAYLPGSWTQAIIFAVILIVVIIRPQGLFGGRA
jgi:branched-chain amino acid transport system permease protein